MKAIDTNVLARFFIDDADDAEAVKQRPAAIAAIAEISTKIFLPLTVMLEFEWVMRGFYALTRKDIGRVFKALCGLENVQIENRSSVLTALNGYQRGLDFADALHLARAESCTAFLSFDRRLKKSVAAQSMFPPIEIPQS